MAHIKAGGTTKGNRDSVAKRLGVKVYGGEKVQSGRIIIRQRGTKVRSGNGTKRGNDDTIFAVTCGVVNYKTRLGNKYVEVLPA